MNKLTRIAAAAALIIGGSLAATPHAEATTIRPSALINPGSVWNERGATIWVRNVYGHTEILHQGQHAYQISRFRLRYDARCVFVETGTVWTSGWYKAKAGITHPTRDYGLDVFAWSKCPQSAKWISVVL